jgi:diguanylate cyclase (GGDEF)-like protein
MTDMKPIHLLKYIQLFLLVYFTAVIVVSLYFREHLKVMIVLELIPPFWTTWMLWITYRRHQGHYRIFWRFMGLATSCYCVAQIIWTCNEWVYSSSAPDPSAADIFWNLETVFVYVGLFYILVKQRSIFKGIRHIFDSIILMIVIGTLGWEFVVLPNLLSMLEHTTWPLIATNLIYSLSGAGVAFCMVVVYLGDKALFHKKVMLLITLAFVLSMVSNSYYVYLLGMGEYKVGHWVDHLWSVTLLALGLAGIYSLTYPTQPVTNARTTWDIRWLRVTLPYSGIAILCFLMIERIKIWDGVVIGTMLTLVLIAVRQIIVVRENGVLVSRMKQMLGYTEYMATHDELSRLPNKRHFETKVEEELQEAAGLGRQAAILFMDLDRFKYVNDSLGHTVGDQLIQQVSNRLLEVTARWNTVVARQGGDEFTILISGFEIPELQEMTQAILNEIALPFTLGSYTIQTSTSIGLALYPQDGSDKMELMKNADAAMYKAKSLGGGRCHFYTNDLNRMISRKMDMERSLRKALERDEFMLCYQPQVNSGDRQIVGVEALIRWRTADGTMVSPAEFIPIAEETGLIVPIGEWVVRTACRQAKQWELTGMPPLKIAFNVSPKQLLQENFVPIISDILTETGMPAGQLILEITENVALTDDTQETLQELKKMGFSIAMDDFGTGFSSLAYLQTFQIDYLKIAQTFIRKMTEKEEHVMVVKAIMAMAKSLNLAVVVEGVETEEEFTILKTIDHCVIQGYYFYRPLFPDDFEKVLNLHNKTA